MPLPRPSKDVVNAEFTGRGAAILVEAGVEIQKYFLQGEYSQWEFSQKMKKYVQQLEQLKDAVPKGYNESKCIIEAAIKVLDGSTSVSFAADGGQREERKRFYPFQKSVDWWIKVASSYGIKDFKNKEALESFA